MPVAEPEWSAAYRGLCLYITCVLQPAWDEEVVVPVSPGSQYLRANIPHQTLLVRSACDRLGFTSAEISNAQLHWQWAIL